MKRELTLGVDFGTSTCSAGVFDRGRIQLVTEAGDAAIPAIVHVPDRGDPIVGASAVRQLATNPAHTVRSIKRILGSHPTDAIVRRHAALASYSLSTGRNGRLILGLESGELTGEQVVAFILGYLRDLAERRFGCQIRQLVASVPSSATPEYERALRRAARLARLKVVETVPEPVAAALALGLHLPETERKLLVCDFGGGTFDVAAVSAGHRRLDVLVTCGDEFLGGDDLDDAMLAGVASAIFKQSLFDMLRDVVRSQRMLLRLEPIKRRLTTEPEARLLVKDAYAKRGVSMDVDSVITREWAESLWDDLMARVVTVVDRTLKYADWLPCDVDHVALVGGSAQVPLFRRLFEERFGPGVISEARPRDAALAIINGTVLRSSTFVPKPRRGRPTQEFDDAEPTQATPNMARTQKIEPIVL